MTWKSWCTGLAILLAAPTLVVAILATWTFFANSRPQPGALQVAVGPQVVFPWQDFELQMEVAAQDVNKKLPPIDMALLVDVSGSMTDALPEMSEAVQAVAGMMPLGADGTRLSLIQFDSKAEILVPWTSRVEDLKQGLARLAPLEGGTAAAPALSRLDEVLAGGRPGVKKVAVWYTDGYLDACPVWDCPKTLTYDEIATAGERLGQKGVDLYAVTPPLSHSAPHEVLYRMTSADRVIEPARVQDLARGFEQVAAKALGGAAGDARFEQSLDVRHFEPLTSSFGWRKKDATTLALETALFPGRSTTIGLSLEPQSMGLWQVGLKEALLSRPDDSGKLVETQAARRPSLLVLSWWTLLWFLLPTAVWGLAHRPQKVKEIKASQTELPSIRQPSLPDPLPPLPACQEPPLEAVPTLFLGVGGQGRQALEAIRQELDNVHRGAPGPHHFLAFDLDRRSASPEAVTSAQAAVRLELAPATVTELQRYLPEPGRVPEVWKFFDAARYRDAAREDLDLAGGSRGDRALGRLALFRWLAEADLTALLRSALQAHLTANPAANLQQVVVLAGGHGGFGGGTLIDWGRLARRLWRELQDAATVQAAPQILAVLIDSEMDSQRGNRRSLELELQTAQESGAQPWTTDYGAGASSRQLDREPPFQAIVEVRGEKVVEAIDQVAQLAAILVEAPTRREILGEIHAADRASYRVPSSQARIRTLQVVPALERERRRLDLLARIWGPDVLLDLPIPAEPSRSSSLRQQAQSWALAETPGSPLAQILLAIGGDSAERAQLEAAIPTWPGNVGAWLGNALRASINRHLYGTKLGGELRRQWMPTSAAALLRFAAQRLKELQLASPAAWFAELERNLSHAATALDSWLKQAQEGLQRLDQQRRLLQRRLGQLNTIEGRSVLTAGEDEQEVREILVAWLGDVDTISALREHLFLRLADDPSCRVEVADHLEEPQVHADWQAFEARCLKLAAQLADSRAPGRLATALLELSEDRRRNLAAALVDRLEQADSVLRIEPWATPGSSEARVLKGFVDLIPQPADHGARLPVESLEGSAIRRVALRRETVLPTPARAAFAAMPEHLAELCRQRLERRYRRTFSLFPAALRIALADPAAFERFARFYAAGRVVQRPDESGAAQFYALDASSFLTYGKRSGLAEAAAAFAALQQLGHSNFANPSPAASSGLPFDPGALAKRLDEAVDLSSDELTRVALQAVLTNES